MGKRGKILFLVFTFFLFLSLSLAQAGQLKVTEEHPFLINGSWIPASDLKVGDELTTVDGKRVRITSVEDFVSEDNFSVYNLEAGVYHNFVVGENRVVVHNSNGVIPRSEYFGVRLKSKPDSWSNDKWYEYLVYDAEPIGVPNYMEPLKRKILIGDSIAHIDDGFEMPGSKGAVFFRQGSDEARVVKVFRANEAFIDELIGKPNTLPNRVWAARAVEKSYYQQLENMRIANELGLRKFYGAVEVQNVRQLTDDSQYVLNKFLVPNRAYEMDFVKGGWPSEMRQYITKEKTLADALAKYGKLWNYKEGYAQKEVQFLVTKEGTIEIIDWEVLLKGESRGSWDNLVLEIKRQLGF